LTDRDRALIQKHMVENSAMQVRDLPVVTLDEATTLGVDPDGYLLLPSVTEATAVRTYPTRGRQRYAAFIIPNNDLYPIFHQGSELLALMDRKPDPKGTFVIGKLDGKVLVRYVRQVPGSQTYCFDLDFVHGNEPIYATLDKWEWIYPVTKVVAQLADEELLPKR